MKQLALIPLSLILILTLSSFCQTPYKQLLKAYHSKSPIDMDTFFNTWKRDIQLALPEKEPMNNTLQNIYQVYRKFYDPNSIDSINKQKYLVIYKMDKLKYLLLENSISYGIVDTLDRDLLIKKELKFLAAHFGKSIEKITQDYMENPVIISDYFRLKWPTTDKLTTVTPFYPQLSFNTPESLILTKEYHKSIWKFLLKNHRKSYKDIHTFEKALNTKRIDFLEKYFKVWNGGWNLHSCPHINNIIFDRKLENALIDYDEVSSGGYGYLKKINDEWIVIDVRMTWQH